MGEVAVGHDLGALFCRYQVVKHIVDIDLIVWYKVRGTELI